MTRPRHIPEYGIHHKKGVDSQKIKHYHRPEASDAGSVGGCLVACIIVLGLLVFGPKACAQPGFTASRAILTDKTAGTVDTLNAGIFIEYCADQVTVRGKGIIFQQDGIVWAQCLDSTYLSKGDGYVFRAGQGRLEMEFPNAVWVFEKVEK